VLDRLDLDRFRKFVVSHQTVGRISEA